MSQLSIFDILYDRFQPKDKIRLIELFAGYGSQYLACKYLGLGDRVEHYRICEWAVKSIQAYNDLHVRDYTDYASWKSMDYIYDYLYEKGISLDYNSPMTLDQIKRKGESWCKATYNNIIATKNLVNITTVKAADLCITDTDKYTYIISYSFPCQDLSLAGLTKGLEKGSGTRSSLLWEVERILEECGDNKPQVLLMENVTQVRCADNEKSFNIWVKKLEELGYTNYIQDMIATDYCIPQTRDRTFMVSILGNYTYSFPMPMKPIICLKDLLEKKVDEKYYLTNKQIEEIKQWKAYQKPLETMEKIERENICPTLTTRTGAYAAGMILIKEFTKSGLRIRKLTPKECWRLQGVKDKDFNLVCKSQSDASLYHLAGDSIVTTCLMGIFGELLHINNYKQKILELIQELKEDKDNG